MSHSVNAIAWGLPCCPKSSGQMTGLSLVLRVAAITIGILCIIGGSLNVSGILLSHLAPIPGWVAFSLGCLLTLTGASIKCVKKPANSGGQHAPDIKNNSTQQVPKKTNYEKEESSQAVLNLFPDWLAPHVKNCPYFQYESEQALRGDYNEVVEHPVSVFSTKDGFVGFSIKLHFEHVDTDKPLEPFTTNVAVIGDKDFFNWHLFTDDTHSIQFSEQKYFTKEILGDKFFFNEYCIWEQFIDIENNDALPSHQQDNLAWLLQRLFLKGFFKIKSNVGHFIYEDNMLHQGNFRISIAKPKNTQ